AGRVMRPGWCRELSGACGKKKWAALWENKILNVCIIFPHERAGEVTRSTIPFTCKLNKLEFRYDTEKRPTAFFLYQMGYLPNNL
ncbi:MAG: hypothetical protein WCK84_13975, partial [Bacteroidota bacterium]